MICLIFFIFCRYCKEFFLKKIFGGNLNYCILFFCFVIVLILIKLMVDMFLEIEFFLYEL